MALGKYISKFSADDNDEDMKNYPECKVQSPGTSQMLVISGMATRYLNECTSRFASLSLSSSRNRVSRDAASFVSELNVFFYFHAF